MANRFLTGSPTISNPQISTGASTSAFAPPKAPSLFQTIGGAFKSAVGFGERVAKSALESIAPGYVPVFKGFRDLIEGRGLKNTINNVFTEEKQLGDRYQNQIKGERQQIYNQMVSLGKSEEEAFRSSQDTLTPTERNSINNMVLGFINPSESALSELGMSASKFNEELGIAKDSIDKIISGTLKMRPPKSIKTDWKELLGQGNYMRIFKNDSTLPPPDEMASQLGITENELMAEISKRIDKRGITAPKAPKTSKIAQISPKIAPEKELLQTSKTKLLGESERTFEGILNKIPNKVETDIQHIGEASLGAIKQGKEFFDNGLNNAFRNWVNTRSASKVAGMIKRQEFRSLDSLGEEGIARFQAGERRGLEDVKKYFDSKWNQLNKAGFKVNYKVNYLPQIWKEPPEKVAEVFKRRLGLHPSFTIDSLFKDYQEGKKAGLTPKFNSISELTSWYEQRANKALADMDFFKFLADNNYIQSPKLSPIGWKSLNPDTFPLRTVKTGEGGIYSGVFKSPPDLADAINNYLSTPEGLLAKFAKFASLTKQIVLTQGIPKTGLNFHGVNVLARNMLFAKNPISGFLSGAYYLISPKAAENFINANLEGAEFAVKNGLTLATENRDFWEAATLTGNKTEKIAKLQNKWFAGPLFEKVIPALKLNYFNTIFADLSHHYSEQEAAGLASKITNNIYGGLNLDELGRSKQTQNFFRSIILAPDWTETNVRIGAGLVKGIFKPTNPQYAAYRTLMRNIVAGFMATNIINKTLSGHWLWENDAGHTTEIEVGRAGNGDKRYYRPFGTAIDYLRIPYDVAAGIAKGDLTQVFRAISNRISAPLSPALRLLSNVDAFGRQIYGKRFGKKIPFGQQLGGVIGQVAQPVIPQYGEAMIDLFTGRDNFEEAFSQSIGAPLRYVKSKRGAGSGNRFNR